MPLREQFRTDGERLFRWRSYLPLLVLVGISGQLLAGRPEFARHPAWDALCFAVASIGQLIRILVAGRIPAGSSGRNTRFQIAQSLNTTGLYSMVRHPLYLGNFFLWIGIAMIPARAMIVVVVGLLFWLYHERIMYAEEEFLRERFKDTYSEWASRTPAFVPALSQYRPATLSFSLRAALRREYSSAVALATVFILLRLLVSRGEWGADPPEALAVALVPVTSVYVLLSVVKRKTSWLDVEGR